MVFETFFPGGEIRSIFPMTEYEKIYQFENLHRAYKMAARCKRTKREVIQAVEKVACATFSRFS